MNNVIAPVKRKRKTKSEKEIEAYNAEVRARHSTTRAAILKLRPDWDPAELEKVTHGWGYVHGQMGLNDIHILVEKFNALEAKFSKK